MQRVNKCLDQACGGKKCMEFINCRQGHAKEIFARNPEWELWRKNKEADACFIKDGFDFGICETAVNLTTHTNFFDRYLYSLFWGFQVT